MMFRTHIIFAFLISLIFLSKFEGSSLVFILLVLLSSSIVDIDNPGSKIGKKFWFLSKPFNVLFGHRKLFHSLLVPIVLGLVIWFFFDKYWMPVFLGYASHILLDGFTLNGVNFIYPIRQLRLSGFIETGKKQEIFIFWGFVVLSLLLLFKLMF